MQHKISNLAVQKNGYWGMFVRFCDGATIKNVNGSGSVVSNQTAYHKLIGGMSAIVSAGRHC